MELLEIGDQRLAVGDRVVPLADLVRAFKAENLEEKVARVRSAWYDRYSEPESFDEWIETVFDDRVIVQQDGKLFSYPYAENVEGEIEFGEPVEVERVFQEVSKAMRKPTGSRAIKMLREENGGVVVGEHLLLWGDSQHKDLQAEYFEPDTELWLDHYKSVPALFHHGLDDTVGLSVIGHRVKAEIDDIGVWVEDWIDTSNKYWSLVKPLLEAERLYYSPGSAPHLVKTASDGKLLSFPVVEDTLTPIPAQHRLLPIGQIKAAYKAAGIELPEGFEPDGEAGDPSADTGVSDLNERTRKAKAAKARALLISIQEE